MVVPHYFAPGSLQVPGLVPEMALGGVGRRDMCVNKQPTWASKSQASFFSLTSVFHLLFVYFSFPFVKCVRFLFIFFLSPK